MGGPVAQQGRAADWSYGTRLRLLTRRSGVQFPSGPLTLLLRIHVAIYSLDDGEGKFKACSITVVCFIHRRGDQLIESNV